MSVHWTGSSKDVQQHEQGLVFDFSERVSVYDLGPVPVIFPNLGEIRCTIATRLFQRLEAAGFRTHFRERLTSTKMLVQPFNIPEKGVEFEGVDGRLLPLELLFRFVVTEKFHRRIEDGAVDRASVEQLLASEGGLQPGARLRPAFVECSTKHRAADVYVSDKEAASLANIDMATLRRVYADVASIADFCKTLFRQAGFDLGDGKVEGALLSDHTFVLADSISPDELRLVGNDEKSYDKDPVRQWYANAHPDWVRSVLEAKKKHPDDRSKWPSYCAAPPDEIVAETVRRYRAVADAIVRVH